MVENSLVLDIQKDATSGSASVASLLRKAKAAAVKLNITEISNWLDRELNGYTDIAPVDLPEYRKLRGFPRFHNPMYGWRPIHFHDRETDEIFSYAYVFQSIGTLEDTLETMNRNSMLAVPYDHRRRNKLLQMLEIQTECTIMINPADATNIIDAVRNQILTWSLDLERNGILGEGFAFSETERRQAQPVAHTFYAQNIGVVGDASRGANISNTQSANIDINIEEVDRIISQIRQNEQFLPDDLRETILSLLEEIECERRSDAQSPHKIRNILSRMKGICETATSNLAVQGIVSVIQRIL